jgi:hypothetical protein
MRGGDISATVSPRFVVVFEDLLGFPPKEPVHTRTRLGRKVDHSNDARYWEINDQLARSIWDVVSRYDYSVDVVTFIDPEFADQIRERLDDERLPVGRVWFEQPHQLARRLAYSPDIAGVFFASPEYRFTFGSKGYPVDVASSNLMGALR